MAFFSRYVKGFLATDRKNYLSHICRSAATITIYDTMIFMSDEEIKPLSAKHKLFKDEYLKCWNAGKAYKVPYPNVSMETAAVNGHKLLKNTNIQAAIKEHLIQHQIGADEALFRLREMVYGDKPTKTVKKKTSLGDETIEEFNTVDALDKILRVAGVYKDNLNLTVDKITVKIIKDENGD